MLLTVLSLYRCLQSLSGTFLFPLFFSFSVQTLSVLFPALGSLTLSLKTPLPLCFERHNYLFFHLIFVSLWQLLRFIACLLHCFFSIANKLALQLPSKSVFKFFFFKFIYLGFQDRASLCNQTLFLNSTIHPKRETLVSPMEPHCGGVIL